MVSSEIRCNRSFCFQFERRLGEGENTRATSCVANVDKFRINGCIVITAAIFYQFRLKWKYFLFFYCLLAGKATGSENIIMRWADTLHDRWEKWKTVPEVKCKVVAEHHTCSSSSWPIKLQNFLPTQLQTIGSGWHVKVYDVCFIACSFFHIMLSVPGRAYLRACIPTSWLWETCAKLSQSVLVLWAQSTSLDSCQKRFMWTHTEGDLAPHPVVGFVLQVGDTEKIH